ncbi:MAG: tetratricopeptide repeat protein, partial [Thermoplasmata archaeon]
MDLRAALDLVPETLESYPDETVSFLLQASEVACQLDGSSKIAGLLRGYLGECPDDEEAWSALARVLASARRAEEAIGVCDEGMDACQAPPSLSLLKAKLLLEGGSEEEALTILWHVAASEGPWPEAMEIIERTEGPSSRLYLLKGAHYRQQGDMDQCLEAFESVLEEDPRCVEGYQGKAEVFIKQGRWEEAYECVKAALELESTHPELWEIKAQIEEMLGQVDETMRSLQVSLRYDGENLGALKMLGRLLLGQEKYEEALEVFERAAEIASDDVEVLEGWRTALKGLERWEEFLGVCRKLVDLDPDRREILLDETFASIRLGKAEEASESLRLFLDKDGGDVEMLR